MGRVCCMRIPFISYQLGTMKRLLTAGITAAVTAVMLLPNAAIAQLYLEDKPVGQSAYVVGRTPGSTHVAAYISGKAVTKSLKVNACGFATLTDARPKDPVVWDAIYNQGYDDATTYSYNLALKYNNQFIADAPNEVVTDTTKPTCTGTGTVIPSTGVTYTTHSTTRDVYILGLTPSATVAIDYLAPIVNKSKANACGIAVIKPPTSLAAVDLGGDGRSQPKLVGQGGNAVSYEGRFTALPLCRKNAAGGGTLYVPAPN
jgi:hypothetical protein